MTTESITVLLIEDNAADARLIRELLNGTPYNIFRIETAATINSGLDKIKSGKPDVVLLDLSLPDSRGIDSLNKISSAVDDIPVIVLTGMEDDSLALEAVQKGAQDYLIKGQVNGYLLRKSISYAIERKTIESRLKSSEERARAISDSSMDAITVIDSKGAITYFNYAAEIIFGYSKKEIIGLKLHDIIVSPEAQEGYIRNLPHFEETGICSVVGKTLEVDATRRDGSRFPIELSISAFKVKGQWHSVGSIRDISKRKKMEAKLREAAITDELTGILNRRGFFTLADQQCKLAKRSNRIISILYLDIDNMKSINDRLSHKAGDLALQETARLLQKTYRGSDIIARIGGDEFAVMLTDSSTEIENTVKLHLEDNLAKLNSRKGREFSLSLSMGFSYFNPDTPCSVENLLSSADKLMYDHKKSKVAANNIASCHEPVAEKRKYARHTCDNKCIIDINSSSGLTMNNISLGGVCLRTDRQLIKGKEYDMYLVAPDTKKINCSGTVIWSTLLETGGAGEQAAPVYESGIQFSDMNITQTDSLKEFMFNIGIQ